MMRAIYLGDLLTAGRLLLRGIPVPEIPAVLALLGQPELDLNRPTNCPNGDRIIHFLLRTSARNFQNSKIETLKAFLSRGLNLTQQGAQGDTVFHLLCGPLGSALDEDENLAVLRYLLEEGFAGSPQDLDIVNFRNDFGNTPLLVAVLYGFSKCVEYLLETGADPEIRGEEGRKPLSWAIQRGYLGIANTLLDYGAAFDKDIAMETDVSVMKKIIRDYCKLRS